MIEPIRIREALASDLPKIVRVHQSAFPGFLMTLLGPAFLRAYYQTVLDYGHRIFFVAVNEKNEVQGFVAGFVEPVQFYSFLGTRKRKLMTVAALYVAMRPNLWIRVLENVKQVSLRSEGDKDDSCVCAELASIGVDSLASRQGCGKLLVYAFIQRSRELTAGVVKLTTDTYNNEYVNQFYQNIGFNLIRTSVRKDGRHMNHYDFMLVQVCERSSDCLPDVSDSS